MVKREAARYGVMPVGSEIVGLIPKKAIEMAADYFLQVENFSPEQIFENKLEGALTGAPAAETASKDGKLGALARPFIDAVAAPSATPGGGSVSALAGALAAALAQMVAGLSRKKKAQLTVVDKLSDALEHMRKASDELTAAIDRDSSAYDAVLAAFKMPQGDGDEIQARDAAIQVATRGATEVPLEVATSTVALFERIGQLAAIAAASMKSDLDVARLMAAAGARGALANVEINLDGIKDAGYATTVREKVSALRERLGETSRINA
jgi:formiminotetrahydrofolate cyclodeaminase